MPGSVLGAILERAGGSPSNRARRHSGGGPENGSVAYWSRRQGRCVARWLRCGRQGPVVAASAVAATASPRFGRRSSGIVGRVS